MSNYEVKGVPLFFTAGAGKTRCVHKTFHQPQTGSVPVLKITGHCPKNHPQKKRAQVVAMHIRANQKPTEADHPVQIAPPCFTFSTDPLIPILKLQCRRSKPCATNPAMLRTDQVLKLTSPKRPCTPRVLTDHHLIPGPHLVLCSHQDQAQSAQIANLFGNVLCRYNRVRKTLRIPGPPLHKGIGQLNEAPCLQLAKSLKAAVCLGSTQGIEGSIVLAESFCEHCLARIARLLDMPTRQQMHQTVLERLFWNTAERDDAKVTDYLFRRREMDSVFTLDEATLFDFFFHYLREIQVFSLLERITPKDRQREQIPFIQFIMVFLMKTIGAIPKMEPVHELLLTDELLMGICGFNAYQVRNGSCSRGIGLRTTPAPEIRGAICVDTLANQIVKITPGTIENFFNRSIQQLAHFNIFPKYIHAACDATDYETTKQFKGCGAVTRERKVKAKGHRKNGELKAVTVTVYGWKVWAVYELNTGIPLAIKIDTIEKPDNLHVLAVLQQAKENLGLKSTIRSLVIDRGFLDGKVLYAIDQQGIKFVIPLKRNMDAAIDARQLALEADGSFPAVRDVEVVHGYGKAKYTEKIRTELIALISLILWGRSEIIR